MTPTNSTNNSGIEPGIEPCSRDGDNSLGANLSFLYYFMFVFSVVTSVLALVIIRRFEKLNTVINILLVNLVVSSLIFMSSLPFVGVYMQNANWVFGSAMCKIVFSVYYLGFYSSVFFLTLLTLDRFLAVVYSLHSANVRNRRYAYISCAVVWLISGLACIRPMLLRHSFKFLGTGYCEEYTANHPDINIDRLKKSGFYIQLFFFLILPLAVIIFCYIRIAITIMTSKTATKFHAVRMILIIVVLFFICWIPFNIVELLHDEETNDCETQKRLGYALQVTRNMAYFYFCISPIFYTFVEKTFQEYFKKLLVRCFPGLKKNINLNEDSGTVMPTEGTKFSDGKQSEAFFS